MLKYKVFEVGKYDVEKLKEFVILTDDYFMPKMSARVNLSDYCDKLQSKAYIVEATDGDILAGIGAYYFNMSPEYSYGSYVCALKEYQDEMCGVDLINNMISHSEKMGSKGFKCEIRKSNKPLVKFYKALGFVIDEEFKVENSAEIDLIIHKDF